MFLGYIIKRILQIIPLIILISIIVFIVIQLPPGDYLTGELQRLKTSGIDADPAQVLLLTKRYSLDQPQYKQYFSWIGKIITKGDFGESFRYKKPVTEVIGDRLAMTMLISILTVLLVWVMAVPIGIYSATHQYTVFDYIFTFLGFIGLAIPGFLLALFLLYIIFANFGISLAGLFSPEYVGAAWSFGKFLNLLSRLWLPVVIISVSGTAGLIRVTRAMLLDELQKQYVITARAKGLTERKILFKYPVRVAINPMISTIGWMLPSIISGEVIVSVTLGIPTTGPLLLEALLQQDMFLAGSFLFILSILTVIGTLISDILLAVIDPRIKFGVN